MRLAVVAGLLATALLACAGDDDTAEPATREGAVLDVHLQEGGRWTADPAMAETGLLCPEGSRQVVRWTDADTGTALTQAEVMARQMRWHQTGAPSRYVITVEHVCADGSGTFTLEERPDEPVTWQATGGTGAYAGLGGEGGGDFERDGEGLPFMVHLTGTLTRG